MQTWLIDEIPEPVPPYPPNPDYFLVMWEIKDVFENVVASNLYPNGWSMGPDLFPMATPHLYAADLWVPNDTPAATYHTFALTYFDGFGGSGYSLFEVTFTVPIVYSPPPPGVGNPTCGTGQ